MTRRIDIVENLNPDVEKPGGTRTFTLNLHKGLIRSGYDARLRCRGKKSKDIEPVVLKKTVGNVSFTRALKNADFSDADVVHVQNPIYAVPLKFKGPVVSHLHGDNVMAIARKKGTVVGALYKRWDKKGLWRSDRVIAVDKTTADAYIKRYKWLDGKIDVIPVGIDLDLFRLHDKKTSRKKWGIGDERTVLYVGRLARDKRIDLIIDAFAAFQKNSNRAKLILAGEGAERKKLEEKVKREQIKGVRFKSGVPGSDLPSLYSAADVFVLASLYESGPLVVQESLACGTPAVATDVGRVKEFIQKGGNGYISDATPDAFCENIKKALELSKKRDEIASDAKRFGFDRTMKRIVEVYESLFNTTK